MATWLVFVLLLAISEATVLANSDVTFPETWNGLSSRIVSGWEAQEGQIPHQISLRMVNPQGAVSSCGGSVISPEWGITAAHCTAARVTMVIRAGVVNLTTPLYIFETTKYYNYPLYDESRPGVVQPHDIGLLDFGIKLTLNDFIKPIRLQSTSDKNRNYDGQVLTASGWGRTWTGSSAPENMNWVFLLGNSNEFCFQFYPSIVVDSTICASYYNVTSQSTCQGDSGGPLTVVDTDGELTLVGVTSFVSGLGCHAGMPAGFIRPGHYHEWYTEVTGINFDWEPVSPTVPPTTESLVTEEPTTISDSPTEKPTTVSVPNTEEPTTINVPTTEKPTTASVPNTEEPTTINVPTTEKPTTASVPNTEEPTTINVPTTEKPTTASVPNTEEPTTINVSTTEKPTTTSVPNTEEPTTIIVPTTEKPTTQETH